MRNHSLNIPFEKPGTKVKCPQGCGKKHEILQATPKSISQYYYCGKPAYLYAMK
jgi:hypothetical protein